MGDFLRIGKCGEHIGNIPTRCGCDVDEMWMRKRLVRQIKKYSEQVENTKYSCRIGVISDLLKC